MFFLSFFVSTIFLIGVGIGKYELFPHDQLKYVKDVVSGKLKAEAKAKKEAEDTNTIKEFMRDP